MVGIINMFCHAKTYNGAIGTGDGSQGSFPQSHSACPWLADRGNTLNGVSGYNTESLTVDHNGYCV